MSQAKLDVINDLKSQLTLCEENRDWQYKQWKNYEKRAIELKDLIAQLEELPVQENRDLQCSKEIVTPVSEYVANRSHRMFR